MSYQRTQVMEALQDLLKVFKEAASSKEGDDRTLNQAELHQLINTQLPFLIDNNFEKQFVAFFKCMEGERGTNVDFKAFMCLLATIVLCRDQELSQ